MYNYRRLNQSSIRRDERCRRVATERPTRLLPLSRHVKSPPSSPPPGRTPRLYHSASRKLRLMDRWIEVAIGRRLSRRRSSSSARTQSLHPSASIRGSAWRASTRASRGKNRFSRNKRGLPRAQGVGQIRKNRRKICREMRRKLMRKRRRSKLPRFLERLATTSSQSGRTEQMRPSSHLDSPILTSKSPLLAKRVATVLSSRRPTLTTKTSSG